MPNEGLGTLTKIQSKFMNFKKFWRGIRIPLTVLAILCCYIFSESMLSFVICSAISLLFVSLINEDIDPHQTNNEG